MSHAQHKLKPRNVNKGKEEAMSESQTSSAWNYIAALENNCFLNNLPETSLQNETTTMWKRLRTVGEIQILVPPGTKQLSIWTMTHPGLHKHGLG